MKLFLYLLIKMADYEIDGANSFENDYHSRFSGIDLGEFYERVMFNPEIIISGDPFKFDKEMEFLEDFGMSAFRIFEAVKKQRKVMKSLFDTSL